jgi:hypothetical protein
MASSTREIPRQNRQCCLAADALRASSKNNSELERTKDILTPDEYASKSASIVSSSVQRGGGRKPEICPISAKSAATLANQTSR